MLGEFDLIKRYLLAPTQGTRADGYPLEGVSEVPNGPCRESGSGVALGAGDDAALLVPAAGHQVVVSVDTSVADVHFPADAPAHAIGYRSLAVSLSDLAAMGATPRWCLLALTLPEVDEDWASSFSRGFHHLANQHRLALVGGDVTRGELSVSVTVMGELPVRHALRRDGARAGDLIAVTGPLGSACAGLKRWQRGCRRIEHDALLGAYLYPSPKVTAGRVLLGYANAGMDISDGLAADLHHLCAASQAGAELAFEHLPIAPETVSELGSQEAMNAALYGGDDYQLLVTLTPSALGEARERLAQSGETLTVIGRVIAEPNIVRTLGGELLQPNGWQHFHGDRTER
ncbi:thiamine-phosphate kinase [Carnimonas nigrificans]|uniref:thiamine-phosphate kinase n=1 Tax=Carnimonas nigrificans TaxID=64323 RepID=UPI00046E5451|nr:thiamine-phosphate kinase [Carnimonas nigrificans]